MLVSVLCRNIVRTITGLKIIRRWKWKATAARKTGFTGSTGEERRWALLLREFFRSAGFYSKML